MVFHRQHSLHGYFRYVIYCRCNPECSPNTWCNEIIQDFWFPTGNPRLLIFHLDTTSFLSRWDETLWKNACLCWWWIERCVEDREGRREHDSVHPTVHDFFPLSVCHLLPYYLAINSYLQQHNCICTFQWAFKKTTWHYHMSVQNPEKSTDFSCKKVQKSSCV